MTELSNDNDNNNNMGDNVRISSLGCALGVTKNVCNGKTTLDFSTGVGYSLLRKMSGNTPVEKAIGTLHTDASVRVCVCVYVLLDVRPKDRVVSWSKP